MSRGLSPHETLTVVKISDTGGGSGGKYEPDHSKPFTFQNTGMTTFFYSATYIQRENFSMTKSKTTNDYYQNCYSSANSLHGLTISLHNLDSDKSIFVTPDNMNSIAPVLYAEYA